MIVHPFPQGSPAWRRVRVGKITASKFNKVVTPRVALADNATSRKYLHTLLAEGIMGRPLDEYSNLLMQRGSALEDEAVAYYELMRDCTVERVGFVEDDELEAGCSPDGFVGDDGMIETKCYEHVHHIANLLEVEDSHVPQIQGNLWITGRQWCDRIYYNPELPTIITRLHRDEKYIGKLSDAVKGFHYLIDEAKTKLIMQGCTFAPEFNPDDYDAKTGELQSKIDDDAEWERCKAAYREEGGVIKPEEVYR